MRSRTRALVREFWMNFRAAGWGGAALALGVAGLAFYALLVDGETVADLVNERRTAVERGANVVVVQAAVQGEPLSSPLCSRVAELEGVVAAGGVGPGRTTGLSQLPGAEVIVRPYTGQAMAVLAEGPLPPSSVVVPADYGLVKGMTEGAWLQTDEGGILGPVELASFRPLLGETGAWIFVPESVSAPIVECWVEIEEGYRQPVIGAVRTVFAGGPTSVLVRPAYTGDGADVSAALRSRATQHAHLVAGATAGLLCCLLLWLQRADVGLYRSASVTGAESLFVVAGGNVLWAGLGVVMGWAAGIPVVMAREEGPAVVAALGVWVPVVSLAALVGPVALLGPLITSRSVSSLIRARL